MAATTSEKTRASGTENLFHPLGKDFGVDAASHAIREFWGLQLRTSRALMDHNVSFTRKAVEHYQQQLEEGVKVAQETVKYGMGIWDDCRKMMTETLERTYKTEQN